MTKYHESEHQFKYTWEQVCHAFWCRYPNPYSSHVLSEDVLERRVDAEGKLITKRLFSKTTSVVPKWVERLGLLPKGRTAYIVEESIVDPVNKMLTTYTCNIGMRHVLNVQERCILRAMPDNCAATLVQRWARFESSLRGLSGTVCTFASERFKYNVHKATNGFQLVLEAMYSPHLMLRDNRLDHVTLSQLHPMLRTRLLERARSFKEVAKEAALPLLAVASANDVNSKNVN